jgi:ElaB/YqjD/DUF883 family membrane-anchored ribosome-binding protein
MSSPWNNDPDPGTGIPRSQPPRHAGFCRACEAGHHARRYAREKPAQSMAIALIAGWLIGRLLRACRT